MYYVVAEVSREQAETEKKLRRRIQELESENR
jgi:hypothetical protein